MKMFWSILCTLTCLFLHASTSQIIPSILNELEQENAILEDHYISCPECYNIDNAKRVNIVRTWARSGMPLSILYLKTKPNNSQHKEELYGLNSPPVPLPYRASPSTRGFNSKLFQAASLMKSKSNVAPPQAKMLSQPLMSSNLPIRRQSVVLPQLFVTYGFDNKKTAIE